MAILYACYVSKYLTPPAYLVHVAMQTNPLLFQGGGKSGDKIVSFSLPQWAAALDQI